MWIGKPTRQFFNYFLLLVLSGSLFINVDRSMATAKSQSGLVTLEITIDAPKKSKDVRLWVPFPVSDSEQTISDMKIKGNFTSKTVAKQNEHGDYALYAEWTKPTDDKRRLTVTFNASAIERVKRDFPAGEIEIPYEMSKYLKSTKYTPTDGKVKEIADKIINGKMSYIEKTKAVYDWVVENTFRDPNVVGCGIGDVEQTLAKRGGKCADISSVYVAVARAAGIPSREVFGMRLGKGKGKMDITAGHHCWAEYYMPGYGWIPTDPADVRKIMFKKGLGLAQARKPRDYYYNAVDPYRLVLGKGERGIILTPTQNDGPLNYFMYPYAEVDGMALEWLAAQKNLKYKITFAASKQQSPGHDG
ncbi:Transglutaminase-like enzymes, putative cysteine proteases [hydrothermal vent metagenome]|uniref:Transglutaminase-like enzymes, putative cysteine proteases n=1 Tax=hydrothermal vent metagenome TaxID=652676 RepID=A0A3B1CLC6_9ZZZZ